MAVVLESFESAWRVGCRGRALRRSAGVLSGGAGGAFGVLSGGAGGALGGGGGSTSDGAGGALDGTGGELPSPPTDTCGTAGTAGVTGGSLAPTEALTTGAGSVSPTSRRRGDEVGSP